MAYMSQERKQSLTPAIKAVLKKYGVKASIAVRHHSTLVVNIKSGKIDFIENYIETDNKLVHGGKMSQDQIGYIRKNKSLDVNPYWFQEHFSGKAKAFLTEVFTGMKAAGWYDRSDAMTDYFDTAYYVDVNIGSWKKPYSVE